MPSRKTKKAKIKKGTLAIVEGLNGANHPYEFGVVLHHTAGHNWLVNTLSGDFIYTEDRIYSIIETDAEILDAKKAWQRYSSDVFRLLLQNQQT